MRHERPLSSCLGNKFNPAWPSDPRATLAPGAPNDVEARQMAAVKQAVRDQVDDRYSRMTEYLLSGKPERPDFGRHDPRTLSFPSQPGERCRACRVTLTEIGGQLPYDRNGYLAFYLDDREKPGTVWHVACEPCVTAFDEQDEERFLWYLKARRRDLEGDRATGLHYFRVITDRAIRGVSRETLFADAWVKENREMGILHKLTKVPCERTDPGAHDERLGGHVRPVLEGGLTDRDHAVAAAVIQWLGTNVGSSFLEGVLKQCHEIGEPYRW